MSAYWCELAWLGGAEPVAGVLIETEGERIASVTPGVARAPDGATRLSGLTLPGLANAHSHCFQRALRGRTHRWTDGGTSFWGWREQMYSLAASLDEPRFEALARATFGEMALAGIALVGEFDYIHYSDALIRAATAAGIRLTLIDACYLEGGLPRFRDPSADAWCERVRRIEPSDRVRLGAAIHSVRAVDPDSAAAVAAFAFERGWPLHAHVSEQVRENEACLERYGATPTEVLAHAGAVSNHFTAVHATHVTDTDIERLRDADAYCCMCPTTERDLADGIGRVASRMTLGTDSQSMIDVLEEARAVELDTRLATGLRGTWGAEQLANAATVDGYASLGWRGSGWIRAGALADLTTVSLEGVRLAGTPRSGALDAVIFAASAADVSTLCVGGRVIVRDGRHVSLDVPDELAAAIGAVAR